MVRTARLRSSERPSRRRPRPHPDRLGAGGFGLDRERHDLVGPPQRHRLFVPVGELELGRAQLDLHRQRRIARVAHAQRHLPLPRRQRERLRLRGQRPCEHLIGDQVHVVDPATAGDDVVVLVQVDAGLREQAGLGGAGRGPWMDRSTSSGMPRRPGARRGSAGRTFDRSAPVTGTPGRPPAAAGLTVSTKSWACVGTRNGASARRRVMGPHMPGGKEAASATATPRTVSVPSGWSAGTGCSRQIVASSPSTACAPRTGSASRSGSASRACTPGSGSTMSKDEPDRQREAGGRQRREAVELRRSIDGIGVGQDRADTADRRGHPGSDRRSRPKAVVRTPSRVGGRARSSTVASPAARCSSRSPERPPASIAGRSGAANGMATIWTSVSAATPFRILEHGGGVGGRRLVGFRRPSRRRARSRRPCAGAGPATRVPRRCRAARADRGPRPALGVPPPACPSVPSGATDASSDRIAEPAVGIERDRAGDLGPPRRAASVAPAARTRWIRAVLSVAATTPSARRSIWAG